MSNTGILDRLVLKVPCASSDASYEVPFRDVLDSQQLLHDYEQMWDEGCPNYCRDSTCELIQYAVLVDEGTARDVERSLAAALQKLARSGLDVRVSCTTG